MKVVILGCGRTGATLALELSAKGHDVTVIEKSSEALRRLGKSHNVKVILGNGLDQEIMEKAKVDEADAYFAVTRGDNTNLMAAQIVQRSSSNAKVCAKVADPHRAEAYRKLGVFCINASALLSGMCRDWLLGEPYSKIDEYNVLAESLEQD